MARRGGPGRPPVPDFHLWDEVKRTVVPLRAEPMTPAEDTATLPVPPQAAPKPPPLVIAMPAYQAKPVSKQPSFTSLEPRMRRRLGRGQIDIDGKIDLHGMRQDEARAALGRFIAARVARGDRTVLVITGKGLKKVNGDATTIVERGVLRAMLPLWLTSPELGSLVAGWDQAHQTHGGEGAWYVRLRRVPPTHLP